MRALLRVVVIVLVLALGAYLAVATGVLGSLLKNSAISLDAPDADSLDGIRLEPFAMPGFQCKASFPGKPHKAGITQQLFRSNSDLGATYMLSDKSKKFYLAEFVLKSLDLASAKSGGAGAGAIPTGESIGQMFGGTLIRDDNSQSRNNDVTAYGASDARKVDSALDRFVENWLLEEGATLESKNQIMKGKMYYGREIFGKMSEPGKYFKLRVYCNFERTSMIMVGVIGDDKAMTSKTTQTFIDSCEIW